jgi:hypothetical protein
MAWCWGPARTQSPDASDEQQPSARSRSPQPSAGGADTLLCSRPQRTTIQAGFRPTSGQCTMRATNLYDASSGGPAALEQYRWLTGGSSQFSRAMRMQERVNAMTGLAGQAQVEQHRMRGRAAGLMERRSAVDWLDQTKRTSRETWSTGHRGATTLATAAIHAVHSGATASARQHEETRGARAQRDLENQLREATRAIDHVRLNASAYGRGVAVLNGWERTQLRTAERELLAVQASAIVKAGRNVDR